jgi:hypothetical protein
MRDSDIDDVLKRAAGASSDVDPALLDRISRSLGSSLKPVRPLPPSWVVVSGLIGACVAVAVTGAALLGFYGFQKMNAAQAGLIYTVLGLLLVSAALRSAGEMVPGSPRHLAAWVLPFAGSIALIAVFALSFHDYRTERFVPRGVACLTTGLIHAIPASLLAWLLLRRGFAVDSLKAGLARGALAGLAGVTMLELHCSNFEAPHVMLWHTAVLPLSGAAGMALAWAARARKRAN